MSCHRRFSWRTAARVVTASIVGALVLTPKTAQAQFVERFSLRGEIGVGSMLPDYQRTILGYGAGLQLSGRFGFDIVDPVGVQAVVSYWGFNSNNRDGGVVFVGGGLRLQPHLFIGRLIIDSDVGAGFTGGITRVMWDIGGAFEFDITRYFALGPAARYGQVFANAQAQDFSSDAQFWSVGASATLRIPAPLPPVVAALPPPPPDTDRDGVLDSDDLCVHDPAGEHPDPERRGCPAADTDADALFDYEDACPTVAKGDFPDPDRPGCPDGDDDADVVLNHRDQCRTVHHGMHPDPQRPGCPLADRDNDSVPDIIDHCPDQPGAPHPNPLRNGCPGLVLVQNGQVRILRPVRFATNRDRILRASYPILQAVAYALTATPEIRRLSIEGHTDSMGADDRNLDLSQRRARSVMTWLAVHGVDVSRLGSQGFGETRPVATNDTRVGRAANRRVEFLITDPTAASDHAVASATAPTAPTAPAAPASTPPAAPASTPPASPASPAAPVNTQPPTASATPIAHPPVATAASATPRETRPRPSTVRPSAPAHTASAAPVASAASVPAETSGASFSPASGANVSH